MKSVRNILAMILAASAISATGVTAFAAATTVSTPSASQEDVSSMEATLNATGTTQAPVIAVNVPTSMDYILNPYQITGKPQVLAPEFTIENKSDVPINVMVSDCKPAAALPSGVSLVSKAPTEKSTAKEAYIYLRATVGTTVDQKAAYTKASATTAGDVLVSGEALAAPVLLASLKAGDGAAAADGGTAKGSFLGTLSTPKEDPWVAADKFDVSVVYKFVPQLNTLTP